MNEKKYIVVFINHAIYPLKHGYFECNERDKDKFFEKFKHRYFEFVAVYELKKENLERELDD